MRAVLFACVSLLLVSCVKTESSPSPLGEVRRGETAPPNATTPTAPPEKATPEPVVIPKEEPAVTPAKATPTATPKAAPAKEFFVACGCGCCGGIEDVAPPKACLYHAKGDTFEKIKKEDAKAAKAPQCNVAGCSLGTKYEFCD